MQQLKGRINNQILGVNPVTPMSDQDRISHINQISDENKEKYQFGDNQLIQY